MKKLNLRQFLDREEFSGFFSNYLGKQILKFSRLLYTNIYEIIWSWKHLTLAFTVSLHWVFLVIWFQQSSNLPFVFISQSGNIRNILIFLIFKSPKYSVNLNWNGLVFWPWTLFRQNVKCLVLVLLLTILSHSNIIHNFVLCRKNL